MSIITELQRITQAKADLKTAIESKGVSVGDDDKIDTYASKVDAVYTKGYEKGKAEGGSDSYYDTFWDACQITTTVPQLRMRTDYRYAFAYHSWTAANFKPKYDMKPQMASYMFYSARILGDLVSILETQGVTLDFSDCTAFDWAFYGVPFTRIGVVDMRKASSSSNVNNVFRCPNNPKLVTIDKLIVSETYPIGTSSFQGCTKLENITIEGLITGDFTISSSPLTVESMKSIITHLKDYSGTDKEFTCKVAFSSTAWANLDAEDATSPNNNTWREYINDLGWNVG